MSHWFCLPHLSGLRISGADAAAFVHAQFTSDLLSPAGPSKWRLTAWCNPKGRVIGVIVVRAHEDRVDLVVPASQIETLPQALSRYAIGRKLRFSDPLAVAGTFARTDPRCTLAIDPQRALDLDQAEALEDRESAQRWRLCDLRSGIAWLSPQTSGQFLPQALGLEERGGLSYRKGCYPGQEIIARVHFLGRAKERLSAFLLDETAEISDNRVQDHAGQQVGVILGSEPTGTRRFGLAVTSTAADLAGSFECAGRKLEFQSMSPCASIDAEN